MKRLVFVAALAAVFLVAAFSGANVINKDAPAAVSPEADISNPVDSSVPASPFDGAPSDASPSEALPGQAASPEASPTLPAETPGGGQAAPPFDGAPTDGVPSNDADAGTASAAPPNNAPPDTSAAPGSSASPNNGATPESGTIPDGGTAPAVGTSPDTGPPGSQPPLLSQKVEAAGLTFDVIPYSQLILVAAEGSKATLYCYDRDDNGLWMLNRDVGTIKGYVGKNGISADKREGDGYTPAGLFGLGYAFGNSAKPETGMTWRAVTKDSYWVDDPDSTYYNQWVEGRDGADWDSAEALSALSKLYAYAVVVEYNTQSIVAGKGSAIFLHCKTEPTTGCIAAPQEAILKIIRWLSEDKAPGMLIVG